MTKIYSIIINFHLSLFYFITSRNFLFSTKQYIVRKRINLIDILLNYLITSNHQLVNLFWPTFFCFTLKAKNDFV